MIPTPRGPLIFFTVLICGSLLTIPHSLASPNPSSEMKHTTGTPEMGQTPFVDQIREGNSSMGPLERSCVEAGLVNIREIDPTILVELKYASEHNFMGVNVYGELENCYLQKEAALMLKQAHDSLKRDHPGLRFLVVDGYRPRSVQKRMWEVVKGTPMQRYVANPLTGSMHNYGVAVDITLADEQGNRLDMGTPMDHFGPLAQPREEIRYLSEGKLTHAQVSARRILRKAMTEAGFIPLGIEWWHFDAFPKETVRRTFRMIEEDL
jgi:zinc D-Ala-D-Ala dipeptidase